MNVEQTLEERGKNYGEFDQQAAIAQGIKDAFRIGGNWNKLDPDMKEALDVIANKIGRILNGNPKYADSWHDIAGYATLVDKRLQRDEKIPF